MGIPLMHASVETGSGHWLTVLLFPNGAVARVLPGGCHGKAEADKRGKRETH